MKLDEIKKKLLGREILPHRIYKIQDVRRLGKSKYAIFLVAKDTTDGRTILPIITIDQLDGFYRGDITELNLGGISTFCGQPFRLVTVDNLEPKPKEEPKEKPEPRPSDRETTPALQDMTVMELIRSKLINKNLRTYSGEYDDYQIVKVSEVAMHNSSNESAYFQVLGTLTKKMRCDDAEENSRRSQTFSVNGIISLVDDGRYELEFFHDNNPNKAMYKVIFTIED